MSQATLDDFKKIELRVAQILDVEEIIGADKIWKLTIKVGDQQKTIVAGIKKFYDKQSLIGQSIVVVNNLAPAVIRGVESNGMLLAAKDGEHLTLVSPQQAIPSGSTVG